MRLGASGVEVSYRLVFSTQNGSWLGGSGGIEPLYYMSFSV
jgi:hypothetical protein